MPRRDWSVYKQGAVVLLPVVGVALYAASRGARLASEREARDGERAAAYLGGDDRHKQIEARELDARERARSEKRRATELPSPSGSAPEIFAPSQPEPDALALDDTSVYWINRFTSELVTRPKAGPAQRPRVLLARPGLGAARHSPAVAVDEDFVYVLSQAGADGGSVLRVPKQGGQAVVLADGQPGPASLVLQGKSLYWVDDPGEALGEKGVKGAVMKLALPGGQAARLTEAEHPCAVVADGEEVFFVDRRKPCVLGKLSGAKGPPTTLVSSERLGCTLAVDASRIYWVNDATDEIMTAARSGEGLASLATARRRLASLAQDAGSLYALAETAPASLPESGVVWQIPKSGGKPSPLALEQFGLNALAVDEGAIYWTRYDQPNSDGAVLRTEKAKTSK